MILYDKLKLLFVRKYIMTGQKCFYFIHPRREREREIVVMNEVIIFFTISSLMHAEATLMFA